MPDQHAQTAPEFRPPPDIPPRAGIGLRAPHYREVAESLPEIAWLEVHSENHFGAGGPPNHYLERIRAHYPLSLHSIGMSLGSTDPLNRVHLGRLRDLIRHFDPGLVSDHLCWSSVGGTYLNDLLPLPYTEEALAHVAERVSRVQEFLGRRILVENVSSYLRYSHSAMPEWEFFAEVARRAGCGLLLDVNNVHVSATNHGFSAEEYLEAVPREYVEEIHLAGFAVNRYDEGEILIDHHGAPVSDAVWRLYERALARLGPVPTLIEWDTDVPALGVLLEEARTAGRALEEHAHPG